MLRGWGVVSTEQQRSCGLTRGAIDGWLRVGRLHRLHRGVYLLGHGAAGREAQALAAVLACGPGAVLSHRSAAAWWGLLESQRAVVDVLAPRSRGHRQGIDVHRTRVLDVTDTTTRRRMPVTTVARTLLDLAAVVPAHRLERAVAHAERLRVYDHRAVLGVVARSNGHRGAAVLRAAIDRGAELTRSNLEARVLAVIRAAACPPRASTTSSSSPTTLPSKPISTGPHSA
jgi:hypothetical protein